MKAERVNNIIFTVNFLVFLLQLSGYLAPAWFVKEVAITADRREIRADGRTFYLPLFFSGPETERISQNQMTEPSEHRCITDIRLPGPLPDPEDPAKPQPEPSERPKSEPEKIEPAKPHPKPTEPAKSQPKPTLPSTALPKPGNPPKPELPDELRDGPISPEHGSGGPQRPIVPPPGSSWQEHHGDRDMEQSNDRNHMRPERSLIEENPINGNDKNPISNMMLPNLLNNIKPPINNIFEGATNQDSMHKGPTTPPKQDVHENSQTDGDTEERKLTDNGKHEYSKHEEGDGDEEVMKENTNNEWGGKSENNEVDRDNTEENTRGDGMKDQFGETNVMHGKNMGDNVDTEENERMKHHEMTMTGAQRLYLTAGFWYSRACVNPRDPEADDGTGMQWCTMYTRLDNKTLEDMQDMFELRLEATLAIVLCALSLLISSSACKCSSHQGRRAVFSLAILFISGAVMAIPVVHLIVQHVEINKQIVRPRMWSKLTKGIYLKHDLFDHYSVILCGTGCVISVLFTVILTLISCARSSESDSKYELKQTPDEKSNKYELPINWVQNNKITVPTVAETTDITRDDAESGYSELKADCTASNSGDQSFEAEDECIEFDPEEMKAFDA